MKDRSYFIDDSSDVEAIAQALAAGAVVAHAFGNFYAITTRADEPAVRKINLMKGRPPNQVGSVVTTRDNIDGLFDWGRLPDSLTRAKVRGLIDALYESGPFGFRGPAATQIPDHMTHLDAGVRTVQLIAPGYRCPSNALLKSALKRSGESLLYVTSANRSHHQTGAGEEPAHYRGDALAAEFGREPGFCIIRHRDEAAARRAYPLHEPMSTTTIGFHKLVEVPAGHPPTLFVERHGSLSFEGLASLIMPLGFRLTLAPSASKRLTVRLYADNSETEAAA